MTPPCQSFPASELPTRVQLDLTGRRRKLDDGARRVELEACELLSMMQYKCEVRQPVTRASPVQCYPVERLFRRCMDRKGSFLVETTAWEGKAEEEGEKSSLSQPPYDAGNSGSSSSKGQDQTVAGTQRTHQWPYGWQGSSAVP